MYKRLALPVCLALLAGCTTHYIAPEPVTMPMLGQPATVVTTERVVPVSFNQAWANITGYSQERYRTIQQNKAAGQLTLFVDAFEPSNVITCGMLQQQDGGYNTHTEFLSALANQTPVNVDITVHVKLVAKSPSQTLVSATADYELAIGYQTNPATGAMVGGSRYRFDSRGYAMVNAPDNAFAAKCQATGSVESAILNAASSGNTTSGN